MATPSTRLSARPLPLTLNTWRTPGLARAASRSADFNVPPNTGQRSYTAYSMPGSRVSMPKIGSPRTMRGLSQPPVGWPMMRKAEGSFSTSVFGSGTGIPAAAEATSP
jgi:hypothetical protein